MRQSNLWLETSTSKERLALCPPWQRGVRGVNGQVKVKIPSQRPVMGLPWNRKSQSTKRKKQNQAFYHETHQTHEKQMKKENQKKQPTQGRRGKGGEMQTKLEEKPSKRKADKELFVTEF